MHRKDNFRLIIHYIKFLHLIFDYSKSFRKDCKLRMRKINIDAVRIMETLYFGNLYRQTQLFIRQQVYISHPTLHFCARTKYSFIRYLNKWKQFKSFYFFNSETFFVSCNWKSHCIRRFISKTSERLKKGLFRVVLGENYLPLPHSSRGRNKNQL